jgi:hypothetical protein
MPLPQTLCQARHQPIDTGCNGVAAAAEPIDLAELIAEARAIVAGAEIRPTRAHLAACLIWLDGGPLTLSEAPIAR